MTEAPFELECLTRRGVPVQRLDPGERLFLEDDTGECMYVVLSGTVDVITFGTVLERVGPGGIFGEMALIDGGPRSAAAMASEPTEVAVIDRDAFHALLREEPAFALRVMQQLSERIRRMGQARKGA